MTGSAAQPRRLAVMVVIARGGARGVPRAKVLSLLWPDADDDQGRRAIAQALYALRRDLGTDEAIVGTQVLRLNSDAVWCDVAEFEAALARGAGAEAVELYAGAFLDGFRLPGATEFERWADDERMLIEHRYHEALETLAKGADSRGQYDEATRWWRRRTASDPLNARMATSMMRSLAASGDVNSALQHARLFEALVAEELAMPADREVLALADALRRELSAAVAPRAMPADRPAQSIAVLPFAVLGKRDDAADARQCADGIAEEIISAILDLPQRRVIGRAASFALGTSPSLAALRELGVSHAIEGCVRRTESGLRVTVRLLDGGDGRALWWHRADCTGHDDLDAQEAVASLVANAVRGNV